MILGIDVSTSTTGWAILNTNGKFIKADAFILKNKTKFPDLFSKALYIQNQIRHLHITYEFDRVFIESALMMFSPGKSSASTISMLLKFNGIVSWIIYEETGIIPEFIPAVSARKLCGVIAPRGEKAKKCVMEHLLKTEPDFADIVQFTKHGNPSPEYFDMADALIVSKAGYLKYYGKC